MRRGSRNANVDATLGMEDLRLIAQKPHIMWVFYEGSVNILGETGKGYNPVTHEGWCIPLRLWQKRDSLQPKQWAARVFNSARKLRIIDDGVIKQNYSNPKNDKWWVLAPPPEANPKFGRVVRAQPPDRAILQVVPEGGVGKGGDLRDRINRLKKSSQTQTDEQEYLGVGEIYVATLLVQPDGTVKIYPQGDNTPMLVLNRNVAEIKTQSTKFDHNPEQTTYGGFAVNPAAKDIPSTNTINVQTFIPMVPDFLMLASIALSVAAFINKKGSKDSDSINETTIDIAPTEYLDYDDLKRA